MNKFQFAFFVWMTSLKSLLLDFSISFHEIFRTLLFHPFTIFYIIIQYNNIMFCLNKMFAEGRCLAGQLAAHICVLVYRHILHGTLFLIFWIQSRVLFHCKLCTIWKVLNLKNRISPSYLNNFWYFRQKVWSQKFFWGLNQESFRWYLGEKSYINIFWEFRCKIFKKLGGVAIWIKSFIWKNWDKANLGHFWRIFGHCINTTFK